MTAAEPQISVASVDERTRELEAAITPCQDELRQLSTYLSDHPELRFEEHLAHDAVTVFLEKHGFEVTKNHLLPTAFKATFSHGSGGRVWGLNSEYDALPGIGHACG